ncbi:SDR family oxidoreductase [Leptospira biflexa]|uniref:SDR family NAD(P)-dependent oxidoreductase n=1 Tax=Leptospira biflexa TaxID=172 RepID=UPI001090ED04|nr:SDR family NAD(P)-dependent oxidoreductase [Leptospira biflexa]TGM44527.1 SDR family oxidoreductase [Leptospira biflexa]TGM45432.1 SDR family oxidoreductase [Leptospira biflexa]TGM53986.1 SDR family oxidoreductase [Leptospira biflexa]
MDLNLKNKRVFVSGGSKGIGLAIVRGFLSEGARVAFTSRNLSTLQTISKSLKQEFPEADILYFDTDATDAKKTALVFDSIVNVWQGLDIVVSNVGDGRSTPEVIQSDEQFDKTLKINLKSAENVVREFLRTNSEQTGSICFISSITGLEAFGAPTDYSVAKAAVISLSKNLARKLAPNIRVNCIAPGNVYSPGGSWDEKMKQNPERIFNIIESTVPMKRFGTPDEIANVVLFLTSDKASFITGSCVVVDGGQTVGNH